MIATLIHGQLRFFWMSWTFLMRYVSRFPSVLPHFPSFFPFSFYSLCLSYLPLSFLSINSSFRTSFLLFIYSPQKIAVNLEGEAEFSKINPNSKPPAIVDPNQLNSEGEPLVVFGSGAILMYLGIICFEMMRLRGDKTVKNRKEREREGATRKEWEEEETKKRCLPFFNEFVLTNSYCSTKNRKIPSRYNNWSCWKYWSDSMALAASCWVWFCLFFFIFCGKSISSLIIPIESCSNVSFSSLFFSFLLFLVSFFLLLSPSAFLYYRVGPTFQRYIGMSVLFMCWS